MTLQALPESEGHRQTRACGPSPRLCPDPRLTPALLLEGSGMFRVWPGMPTLPPSTAFQTEGKLYLILDFLRGGDLFSRLSKEVRGAGRVQCTRGRGGCVLRDTVCA